MCLLRFCSPISPVYTEDIAAWRRFQKGDAMTFVAGQVTWHPHRLGTTFFTEARQTKETHYISSHVRRAKTALRCLRSTPAPAARAVLLNARCRCWVDAVSWFTPLVLFVQPLNFCELPVYEHRAKDRRDVLPFAQVWRRTTHEKQLRSVACCLAGSWQRPVGQRWVHKLTTHAIPLWDKSPTNSIPRALFRVLSLPTSMTRNHIARRATESNNRVPVNLTIEKRDRVQKQTHGIRRVALTD